MKNKKNIYFLIPAVLLIWGIIGYRIVRSINPPQPNATTQVAITDFKPKEVVVSKPYSINANYRDPFLGTMATNKKKVKRVVQKKPVVFPSVQYVGFVAPIGKKKSPVFILKINGQQELLKKRETAQELQLVSGNQKEVVLKYKGIKKTFSIQN
ncbi:MAG: hypothetical protein PSN34_08905 [Urechidicola sp.]|nr:hypothetical protein [Urechidicola sp.]